MLHLRDRPDHFLEAPGVQNAPRDLAEFYRRALLRETRGKRRGRQDLHPPKQALERLLATVPALSMNFIRVLSGRLTNVAREHGIRTPGGTEIAVRLTHEELANLIGTTRETVTTQLGRFRRMGMVRREGKTMRVNVARLSLYIASREK